MLMWPSFVCEYLHVPDSVYQEVYEPSEDTFLLIDALHVDLPSIDPLQCHNVIEVGVGSGVVLTSYMCIWKQM